jgi:hypothetical protein
MKKEFMVLAEGDRMSELKVNVPGLIYYFVRRYEEKTRSRFPRDTIVWSKDGAQLKRTVLDDMVVHGLTAEEMKEFVDWVFAKKPEGKWHLEMLRYFYRDWIKLKTRGNGRRFADARDQQAGDEHTRAARRLEEKQFLDFLVEGYFDHKLTRRMYALALNWRARNATAEEKMKISQRHAAEYSDEVRSRLMKWMLEIDEAAMVGKAIAYDRLYIVELARQKEMTVGETLDYFFRDEQKSLFSGEELTQKDLDEIGVGV